MTLGRPVLPIAITLAPIWIPLVATVLDVVPSELLLRRRMKRLYAAIRGRYPQNHGARIVDRPIGPVADQVDA
jgi:hypothetical protein